MKMSVKKCRALVLGGFLAFFFGATATMAHHSTSGFTEEVVKIEGTITQFRWTNPHASIKIDGSVDGGDSEVWTIELTAPTVLVNQGWKRNSLTQGDEVTIYARPMRDADFRLRDGSVGGLYVGAILADGSTLGNVDGSLGE